MDWKNQTLQSIWKMSKEKLIFIFCSGLLLFILSIPSDGNGLFGKKESVDSKSVATGESGLTADGSEMMEDRSGLTTAGSSGAGVQAESRTYEAELEQRVRSILANVDGVGELEVMVVLKSSEENVLHIDKSSEVRYPELSGIIISADGGGSTVVKTEISEAMEALFGLPSHKIKVLKRVKKESEK